MEHKAKTARFAAVVAQSGRPREHLTFLAAEKDSELQAAVEAHRVMSLIRFNSGTKKDYGLVGYVEELASQALVFPKSLKSFEGRRIVGINYDLLAEEKAAPARNPRKPAVKAAREKDPLIRTRVAESDPQTSPTPAPVRRKRPLPASSKPAAKKKLPIQKKAPKPPRLTIRQKLENVLHEWETGSGVEAKRMLSEVVNSLRAKAH